jgi:hypothetical protein
MCVWLPLSLSLLVNVASAVLTYHESKCVNMTPDWSKTSRSPAKIFFAKIRYLVIILKNRICFIFELAGAFSANRETKIAESRPRFGKCAGRK